MATEDKLWIPPLSPKDQEKLDQLQKNGRRLLPKWTGFAGKTLWDWLQLLGVLAIPLVVALATLSFGLQQANLAQQQHDADQQRTLDQQQTTILQAYIDNIQDLLLNHRLSTKPTDEIAILARARTLTALRGLDPVRKGVLVQFIYDAGLIGSWDLDSEFRVVVKPLIISLADADLFHANLTNANLTNANLTNANLTNANLTGAILVDTTVTQQQLDQVFSCKDAALPKGLTCHKTVQTPLLPSP